MVSNSNSESSLGVYPSPYRLKYGLVLFFWLPLHYELASKFTPIFEKNGPGLSMYRHVRRQEDRGNLLRVAT